MRTVLFAGLLLTGCASQSSMCPAPVTHNVPYEVKVPVYVERTAPGELIRPYKPTEYPAFISPSDSAAKYGISELDWQRLQVILRTLQTRDKAWRDWAVKPNGASAK